MAGTVYKAYCRDSSPLFLITRSSSFSVIHVSLDIKKNVAKDSTLLLSFFSKSPGGHAISPKKTPRAACGIIPVNCGIPVVRKDGRAYGHVITKLSWMDGLQTFLRYGALLAWSSAIKLGFFYLLRNYLYKTQTKRHNTFHA